MTSARESAELVNGRRGQFGPQNSNPGGITLLRERFSCRAFLDEPVSEEALKRILDLANRSPSWCNTQPWTVTLVQGESREALVSELLAAARDSQPAPEIAVPERYEGVHQERRRGAGYALYESAGIERSDTDARAAQALRNLELFGAPCALLITVPRYLGPYALVDVGAYLSYLQLAAQSFGVATILQAALAMHPEAVRKVVPLPADEALVCGISLGYPDLDHPANSFETERNQWSMGPGGEWPLQ
ncbi:nitroreductase [Brevibacterium daeguense]|uniref:Nitroreductase n=1 Tax=Brevibacterium daeguense TaxID=909936 RepID=A0ABP8EFH4_9MICO|nr:nitroreductase [Brevibacterium daeguense]